MFDFSFFALLFLLATTFAPEGSGTLVLENTRHPDQSMSWTRQGDGRWAMTINGRELGIFERAGDTIVHTTGQRAPDHFPIAELAHDADLRRDGRRVRLRGRFEARVVDVAEDGGAWILTDRSRELLRTPLRLIARGR